MRLVRLRATAHNDPRFRAGASIARDLAFGRVNVNIRISISLAVSGVLSSAAALAGQGVEINNPASVFGVAINVSDVERSAKLYRDIFGLKEVMQVSTPQGLHELVLSRSGKLAEDAAVVLTSSNAAPVTKTSVAFGRVILTVANAHSLADKAKNAGYTISMVSEPKPPSVAAVVIFLKDPDGYTVELFQPVAKKN